MVCSQVLAGAVVFNDKVGSWNVASVSNMAQVCPLLPVARACGCVGPCFGVGWPCACLDAWPLGRFSDTVLLQHLVTFGAWAGVSNVDVSAALASVPRELCAMRRLTARGLLADVSGNSVQPRPRQLERG